MDPVDLMLLGRMDEAAKMYLNLYLEAIEEGDRYIGPDLLSKLHFCLAGKETEFRRVPEDTTLEVEQMVLSELRNRGMGLDEQIVMDDIAIAKNNVVAARENSERLSRRWI